MIEKVSIAIGVITAAILIYFLTTTPPDKGKQLRNRIKNELQKSN